jgi:hypothetical protein
MMFNEFFHKQGAVEGKITEEKPLKLHRKFRGEFNRDQCRANGEPNPLDKAVRGGFHEFPKCIKIFLPIMRQLI